MAHRTIRVPRFDIGLHLNGRAIRERDQSPALRPIALPEDMAKCGDPACLTSNTLQQQTGHGIGRSRARYGWRFDIWGQPRKQRTIGKGWRAQKANEEKNDEEAHLNRLRDISGFLTNWPRNVQKGSIPNE